MAQLVISAAGAAVGFAIGGPTGAQIGWAAGSLLGSALGPAQRTQGPRLNDLKVASVSYGAVIAYVEGHPRLGGAIAWQSDKREISTTVSSGKGGPSIETETYTYEVDCLYMLSENEIAGVRRVWSNGELVWTAASDADTESLDASAAAVSWRRMTVYTGDAAQLPDPTYEAAFGVGNVPANRGRGSVFFEGMNLGNSGQFPNLTFEVVQHGTVETTGFTETFDEGLTPYSGTFISSAFQISATPWGYGLESFGGVESAVASTAYRDFSPALCERISFKFNVTAATGATGEDDAAAIEIYDTATSTTRFLFTPRREKFYDSSQRPFVSPGSNLLGTLPLSIATWYRLDWVMASALTATVTITDLTTGVIFLTETIAAAASGDVSRLKFFTASSVVAGTLPAVIYDEIVIGTGGSQITLQDVPLDEVVERQCERAGLSLAYVDASALAVKSVRAMAVSQITSPRQVIDMLAAAYAFEPVESDMLKFVLRGGAPALTVPYGDMAASLQADTPEPLPLTRSNDIELPAQVSIKFANVDDDYQDGTEMSDRLITGSSIVQSLELPIGLTPTEAKRIADVAVMDLDAGLTRVGPVSLSRQYAALEPTDVVTLTGHDGSTFRTRLTKRTEQSGVLTFEGVLDDASTVTSTAETSGGYTNSTTVRQVNATLSLYLDIPILRDAENGPGFYWAAKAAGDKWSGAALYGSRDAVSFARVADLAEQAIFGTCTTVLGSWAGGRMLDEANSVTVNVGDGVTLSSSTRDAVLGDQTINAMLIGSEILQFITATYVSSGIYTLTRLLRGSRGTEWATVGHQASERCCLLRTTGLRRAPVETYDIGLERSYKAVSYGLQVANAYAYAFTDNAVGLKPFSPFDLRASRDAATGDITLTWQRRSRLATRTIGALGISIPLGESVESYSIDIFDDGTYTTVVRTLNSLTPTVAYTSAQQVADFGSNQGTVYAQVFQLSDIAGRGYHLEAAA